MIAAAFARLSTGIKMLLILSAALLPLGVIALLASLESAQANRLNREAEARLMAGDSARNLGILITRDTLLLRTALMRIEQDSPVPGACLRALATLAAAQRQAVGFAVATRRGRRLCATPTYSNGTIDRPPAGVGTEVRLLPDARALRFTFASGDLIASGELPFASIVDAARPRIASGSYGMVLRQGDAAVTLANDKAGPLAQTIRVTSPVANGQLALELMVSAAPVRAIEILMVLLPLMMWASAAVIGWLVVDRLLLRPLERMQRAVANYSIGDGPLTIPTLTTPAQELRGLGQAFEAVTSKLSAHEAELELGLARQTRLTREVHHRVKNNLQVVSSLISLHARAAKTEEATEAYSSIQRRVDALAVVHRNHYAELEENRGVGLRALIGELASNLRATAPPHAHGLAITLELMPAHASQDVAVPIAFLITELVELVMDCEPKGGVAIRLRPTDKPDRAELSLIAPGLTGNACLGHPALERFNRVILGLSRQLRSPLVHDPELGSYAIAIAVVPPEERS